MTIFQEQPELLRPFRQGNRQAMALVYRRYVQDVARVLRLGFAVGDSPVYVPGLRETPELLDALQEVFTRAFTERARLSYDGLRPYRPFLLTVARNLRIDQVRASRREVALLERDWLADGSEQVAEGRPAGEVLAEQGLQESREWERLQAATRAYVAGLEPELGRFVELRFTDARPQAEVAEIMGTTRRLVRTREEQVKAGLRRYLLKHGLV